MLLAIRERLTGWVAYTIVILLSVPFALWGINSYLDGGGPTEVAKVGKAEISQNEFQRAFRQQLSQLQAQGIDPNRLDDELLRRSVLEQLITARIIEQTSRDLGLRVSDQQLDQVIRSLPAFQDNGRFDIERYQRRLLQEGYSAVGFEEMLREALVAEQLQQGMIESAFLTSADLHDYLRLQHQRRRFEYLVFSLDDHRGAIDIDAETIEDFYQANPGLFLSPEQVRLEYLELTVDELAAHIAVDEQALQAEYQRRSEQLSVAERRQASHILIRVVDDEDEHAIAAARDQAEDLHQRILTDDADFADVLADALDQANVEGGELGTIEPGLMDPSFENALFALAEVGAVSPPIRTRFGFHIIRLDGIREGETTPFADVRDELAGDLRLMQAERQFFDAAETLANITFEQPDSLFPAAEMLDLPVQESDWIDRSSRSGIAHHEQVRNAAFSPDVLMDRLNSPALELEPGHVIVLRIADYQPADILPLEDVREQIVTILRDQQAIERLQRELEEALSTARSGLSLAELADATGAVLQQPEPVTRTAQELDARLLATVFELTPPSAGEVRHAVGELSNGDQALLALHEVIPGDIAADDPEWVQLRDQLGMRMGDQQFEHFIGYRRQQLDIRIRESRLQ